MQMGQLETKRFQVAKLGSLSLVMFLSLLVTYGWLSNNITLITFPYPSAGMNVLASITFNLLVFGGFLLDNHTSSTIRRNILTVISLLIFFASATRLVELFFHFDLQLDLAPIKNILPISKDPKQQIGRMAYPTAMCFMLISTWLFLFLYKKMQSVRLFLGSLLISYSLFSVLLVLFGVSAQYFGLVAIYQMSFSTSLCFFFFSIFLLLCDSEKFLSLHLISELSGGKLLRHFLVFLLVIPVSYWGVSLFLETKNIHDLSLTLSLAGTITILSFVTLSVYTAISNNHLHAALLNEIGKNAAIAKEAEESKEFVNVILNNIPDLVFVKSTDSLTYTRVNSAFEKLTGKNSQEILGKTDYELFKGSLGEKLHKRDEELFEGRLPFIDEQQLIDKEGNIKWFRVKKVIVKDSNNISKYLICISDDITELKQKRDQLEQYKNNLEFLIAERTTQLTKSRESLLEANQKLISYNKELEQFAYIASHDLQEPLSSIRALIKLYENEYADDLAEQQLKYLHFIAQSSERMSDLINSILDYSKIGLERNIDLINVKGCISTVLQDLRNSIVEANAIIEVNELPFIQGYKTEFMLLLQNLISNAIKYRRTDRQLFVRISCANSENNWQFTISDNGIGIPTDKSLKIFQIFKRLHNRKDYEGAGIGLAHCKKIIELHGGSIWVEPNADQGADFHFTIPKKITEPS